MHQSPQQLYVEARKAWEAQDWARSGELYEQLVGLIPDGPKSEAWWFDAALAYKFLRDWPKAYQLGIEAAARAKRGVQDPAFWNLGIAATVLREWAAAREAWDGYGVPMPPGEGEIVHDFGVACVRITAGEGQEVVWVKRICPTRARIISVPFDPSRRFGEVVLHDGAPNGERVVDSATFPVFDEILLFEPSDLATLSLTVTAANPDDVEALCDLFVEGHGLGAEPMTSRVLLCKCCSEGSVSQERQMHAGEQQILVAAPQDLASALLDEWRDADPAARSWRDLHLVQ